MIEAWDDSEKIATYIHSNGGVKAVEEIIGYVDYVGKTDEETAHSVEDKLHVAVLRLVALVGNGPARDLAIAALKTQDLEHSRWSA